MDISGESHTIGHSRCGLEYPFIFFTQNIKDGGNGALCAASTFKLIPLGCFIDFFQDIFFFHSVSSLYLALALSMISAMPRTSRASSSPCYLPRSEGVYRERICVVF